MSNLLRFNFGFFVIFILILSFYEISIALKEKSIEPVIKDAGGKFFFTTNDLKDQCEIIIQNKGIKLDNSSLINKIISLINGYLFLFLTLSSIYFYISFLYLVCKVITFSGDERFLVNVFLAFILFILIQGIFLIVIPNEYNLTKIQLLELPLKSFISLFKCLPYIFSINNI